MLLSPRFTEAFSLAAQLHRNQVRKGPREIPYLSHLLAVAGTVIEYGGTENEAIAALLHDAIEDQGGATTREIIRRLFGDDVTVIVEGVTDTDVVPKPPWRQRKERFLATLPAASPAVLKVLLADKLSNVRSTLRDLRELGDGVWARFKGGKEGTLWYYRAVVAGASPTTPELAALRGELEEAVAELERLAA